ncbi:MAG: hypothetical protein PHE49_04635, partial [bacterium]|nr:hypothetical protein [bacterium]
MKKIMLLLCFCFISSGLSAVEAGNTEAQRDSLVAKLKGMASSDTGSFKTEKIKGQVSAKDSLLAKLKNMTPLDTNISKTEGQDSVKDSFTVKSES